MQNERDNANHDDKTKWLLPAYMADQPHLRKQTNKQLGQWIRIWIRISESGSRREKITHNYKGSYGKMEQLT
jgi:hypothetical protein